MNCYKVIKSFFPRMWKIYSYYRFELKPQIKVRMRKYLHAYLVVFSKLFCLPATFFFVGLQFEKNFFNKILTFPAHTHMRIESELFAEIDNWNIIIIYDNFFIKKYFYIRILNIRYNLLFKKRFFLNKGVVECHTTFR